ncbi:MAG: hypothetical protein KGL13_02635 [Gammaproteobacteria bacterium]|nr:hypothetical protein [Gammaproteobacteria bacterium]MDE2345343.1 hypothetical protein [Gammaproteobacteria bacterium]
MSWEKIVFLTAGVLAILYGLVILWSVASGNREVRQSDWLKSEEVKRSPHHSFKNLRHLLEPERRNISISRSRVRGYAMVAIGIVLIVFGVT